MKIPGNCPELCGRARMIAGVFALTLLASGTLSAAEVYTIQVDTTQWKSLSAEMAFDFVGYGAPSNIIDITNFQTDGVIGTQTFAGAAYGTLTGTVTMQTLPSNFFNEDLASITLGTYIYFQFQTRVNIGPGGAFPDEFSFFVLDGQGNPLIVTTDPTGSDAIATFDLTGDSFPRATSYSNVITVIQGAAPFQNSTAPEPATWILIAAGGALLALLKRVRTIHPAMVTILVAGSCAFAQNSPPGLLGEDGWISIQKSGLRFNRTTNTFDSTVTLVNLNSKPIPGPFYLSVSGVTDARVSLANSAGLILEHIPYIPLSTPAQLPVGQPVVAGTLKFNNPSMVGFQFNTGVWDAVSLGIPVNMSCPNPPIAVGAGDYTFTTPIDNYGRQASCLPASGSYFPIGTTLVQCVTGGTGSQYNPGYCNFNYKVYDPPQIGGGVSLAQADLSLGTCQQVLANPAGEIILSGGTYSQNRPCAEPPNGTATFSIANNGLYPATNVVLSLGVPKQFVAAFAMQFSQAATCKDLGPGNFPDGTPFTQGDIVACTFDSLNAGEMIQASVGYDMPPTKGSNSLWTLNAYVSSDTPDPDKTNNAIGFCVFYRQRVVLPPVPASCKHDPDDHTFAVLIDTCGVPPLAVEIVTDIFLGAAALVTGAGEIGIVTGALDVETNILFASASQVIRLLNPVYDPEL